VTNFGTFYESINLKGDTVPKMIRFLWLNAFIAVCTTIFCLWGFLVSIFDKDGRKIHFYVAVPWSKVVLWVCGIKVRAKGQENIDSSVPRIYVTNHQSYFDIFALLANIHVDFKFIVKQELMRIPLFGFAMRKAGYIGIERDDMRKAIKSMNKAAEKIKGGVSILIFSEGTRSTDGRLQSFKRGGFHLACKSGCDIVPVTITNSYRIVPKGSLKVNKGSIDMQIGKPISVKGYTKKNVSQLIDRVRGAMLRQMEETSPNTIDNKEQTADS
jgi:1-acyl-sn-glycerol-3-phosphate acyltransferase